MTVLEGEQVEVSATVEPEGAAVEWMVEPGSVASVDGHGERATVSGLAAGEAVLTGTVDAGGPPASDSVPVTVKPFLVKLNKTSREMWVSKGRDDPSGRCLLLASIEGADIAEATFRWRVKEADAERVLWSDYQGKVAPPDGLYTEEGIESGYQMKEKLLLFYAPEETGVEASGFPFTQTIICTATIGGHTEEAECILTVHE